MSILADEDTVPAPGESRDQVPEPSKSSGLSRIAKTLGLRPFRFQASVLARRIIAFNLIALCVLLLGVLYLNQFRGGLAQEKQISMILNSGLYVNILESRMDGSDGLTIDLLSDLVVAEGTVVRVYLPDGGQADQIFGLVTEVQPEHSGVSHWLAKAISSVSGFGVAVQPDTPADLDALTMQMADAALGGQELLRSTSLATGESVLATARPIRVNGRIVGALVLATQAGYLDGLRHSEQDSVLRLFLLAVGVSIVLSLVLANTIANPIDDLAFAAEAGTSNHGRASEPGRVEFPDLTGRPDEIGHLSRAMRDMTSALYDRIDTNEEFAADVAHEIKNPLASLRSAVETLRLIKTEESRTKLLDVIEHDVRRLDRLVTDISNASRLDAELVKEEMEPFDLTRMLDRIVDFHGHEAGDNGIELIWVQPKKPIMYEGLEARLAQVFVNLITNAVSFCGEGDVVRVWAREKDERILIVVEDTGPGIPEDSLTKVFKRFYSERPGANFGDNSGLGLSISKQIVEAHKGVIWAENIYTKGADSGEALGARFVVGLPV